MIKPIEHALHTLYSYDKQDIIRAFLSAATIRHVIPEKTQTKQYYLLINKKGWSKNYQVKQVLKAIERLEVEYGTKK